MLIVIYANHCLILLLTLIWTAGRPVKHTHCVYEATLLEAIQNEVWHCPAVTTMDLLVKYITLMVAYFLDKFQYMPLHQWHLHTYEVIHSSTSMRPISHHIISYHTISYPITLYHIISHRIVEYRIVSSDADF